jgi:hypothetical protein
MRNRNIPETSGSNASTVDTDADRYPSTVEGLRRVIRDAELPEGGIERLEVRFLASGEATYRVWLPRAEEPEGGYLPPA